MPEDWKIYKLGDIVDQERGISYGVVQPGNHDPKGVPILKVNNLTNKSFDINDLHLVSPSIEQKYLRTRLRGGELLLSLVGSLGEVYCVPETMIGFNVVRALAVIPVLSEYSPKWVEYWLKSPFAQNLLEKIATTSVQATINLKELREIEIPFPTTNEREAIASILSVLDDKIELNLQQNKTLEEMAMALYKHWFVDFGPFQNGEFVESELGLIPCGWEVKSVKDFGEVITGKTPSKDFPEHFGDYVAFVTPTGFSKYGMHITNSDRMISEEGFKKHKRNIIPKNSVIVTCIGSDMGKVSISKVECLTNQQINSLKCTHYFYMYFFFVANYSLLKRLAGDGTTMPIINKSIFENIKIVHPKNNVLREFEELILKLDEQIYSNTLENQTLTTLRDTLLPKLISGEVRVKEAQQILSSVL